MFILRNSPVNIVNIWMAYISNRSVTLPLYMNMTATRYAANLIIDTYTVFSCVTNGSLAHKTTA